MSDLTSGEDLCHVSATELVARLARRELSSVELLEAHLAQVAEWNASVNAIVTLDEEGAYARARRADAMIAKGAPLGVLHGLPVAHKDTHRTRGIRTTFGSPLFHDHVPESNDLIVSRLQGAGAITFGKTNTPEFAAGSHTFNTVFGATRNPWDLSKTPGGSSGGAAVALSLGFQPIADGSDMGGSLRNPASFTGVVGLRPSFGRVPAGPTTRGEERLSVPGAMARNVADIALVLSAIAGPDPGMAASLPDSAALFSGPLRPERRPRRVLWSIDLDHLLPVDRGVRTALEGTPALLESIGWEVVEGAPSLFDADEVFRTLRAAQFFATYGNMVERTPEMFKEAIRWNVEWGRALTEQQIAAARRRQREIVAMFGELFSNYDLVALPVSQVLPFAVDEEYPKSVEGVEMPDYLSWMASCYLISVTEHPALSLPIAMSETGLPVGLQLVGAPRGDLALLQAAAYLEQAVEFDGRPALLQREAG